MGFTCVVCCSSVAYMGDLWGSNIIFFYGVQNLLHDNVPVHKASSTMNWLYRALTSTPSNIFGINWNTVSQALSSSQVPTYGENSETKWRLSWFYSTIGVMLRCPCFQPCSLPLSLYLSMCSKTNKQTIKTTQNHLVSVSLNLFSLQFSPRMQQIQQYQIARRAECKYMCSIATAVLNNMK